MNAFVFNQAPCSASRIWSFMKSLGMEQQTMTSTMAPALLQVHGQANGVFDCSPSRPIDTGRVPPDAGWKKLNVDGAVNVNL